MKRFATLVLAAILVFSFAASGYGQVDVSIPNSSGDSGTSVSIPVNVSDLTGQGIISYQFTVTFDENILDATGVTTTGTLSEASGWTVIPNTNTAGQITVGGFGFSDLSGSGVLVYLDFNVVGSPTQTTNLNFSEFVFNGGTPTANTSGGTFTVTGTLIDITVTTSIGAGTKVYVDGVQKNAPYTTQWYANTSHTIGVDQEQSGASGIKYIYNSWSNGGARNQTVTPSSSTTYTANLDTKYYLTVNSTHDTPQGEGWYDAGTTANFSVTSPTEEGGGSRYRFTQWSGDYSSTNPSGSLLMNAPKTVTANWQRQFYLTTAVSPSGSGTVNPAPPGEWYDEGTNAGIEATPATGYEFSNWSGDLTGSQNPTQVVMTQAKSVIANFNKIVQVTIRTSPTGLGYSVDGTTYSSEQTFSWAEGSEHTLSVDSPQNGATGVRYVYNSWSDGGNQSHTYVVPSSNQTVTANFSTQYFLTVNSPHDTPQGQGWYNSGATANFSVSSPADESGGTRYVFSGWSGDYSGTTPSGSVTMNQPKEVIANWDTQYYLTVTSGHDTPQGAGWYNSGATANFSVSSPADESGGTRYVFTQWSGDYSGTSPSGSVTMTNAKEVIANWKTQYYLTTSENPAAGGDITPSPPGGWYDSGANVEVNATVASGYEWAGWSGDLSGTSRPETIQMNGPRQVTANFGKLVQVTIGTNPVGLNFRVDGTGYNSTQVFEWVENSQHTLAVDSPQSGATGVRYNYSSWTDGGNQSHTYVVPSSNQTVTANFTTQYYLTVTSTHDTPQGEGWYNSGSTANFSVSSPADESGGTRYVFSNWSGDYSGTTPSGSVTMNQPKEVIANWDTQYYLTVTSGHDTPQGAGWYNSGATANFSVSSPADESGGTRYVFTQWSGDYSGTSPSGSVTMTGAKEVIANWKTQYFLAMNENPPEGGDVEPPPPGEWYDVNEVVTISATIANSYNWDGWSGDYNGTDNPTQITMNSPKNITANFVGDETISKPNKPNGPGTGIIGQQLTYSTGGSTSSLGHIVEYKFDWGDGSESNWGNKSKTHQYSETGRFTVRAKARCVEHTNIVSEWSNGKQVDISAYHLTTSVSPQEAGEIQRTPNKDDYSYNESVKLTAVPKNQAYVFNHWGGDLSGNINPKTILMNGNKQITAYFERETVSTPNKPSGENELKAGEEYHFTTGGSVSSVGHDIQYQFDFGDGNQSNWGSASVNYTYSQTGKFWIKARARCAEHNEVVSDWSDGFEVNVSGINLTVVVHPDSAGYVIKNPDKDEYDYMEIVQLRAYPSDLSWEFDFWSGDIDTNSLNPRIIYMKRDRIISANFRGETVSTPMAPSGLASGAINKSLVFTTGGAVSSFGHAVEYQFDWGDGNFSDWGDFSQSHKYNEAGIWQVRARARCSQHQRVVSEWSEAHQIKISAFRLAILIDPAGSGNVTKSPDDSVYSEGEVVELFAAGNTGYYFTEWSGDISGAENPSAVIMDTNKTVTAHFAQTEETISTPIFVTGADSGVMGRKLVFSTGGSRSNLGNPVEYQFKWGDGSLSAWNDSVKSHAYYQTGEMMVQSRARSTVNTSIVSEWSVPKSIFIYGRKIIVEVAPDSAGQILVSPDQQEYADSTMIHLTAVPAQGFTFSYWNGDISGNNNPVDIILDSDKHIIAQFSQSEEQISPPIKPIAVVQGVIGQLIVFATDSAKSNLGNEVEYQFNWGDGTLSQWGGKERRHSFYTPYTFEVRARARSKISPDVISNWSAPHLIEITGLNLTINVDPESSGVVIKSPLKNLYAYKDTVHLYPVAWKKYKFDYWTGDLTGDMNPAVIIMNESKEVTAHFAENILPLSAPEKIIGPDKGYRRQMLTFVASRVKGTNGEKLLYQFDWGDGLLSVWNDSVQAHTYFKSGNYLIKTRVRSFSDSTRVSDWSSDFKVDISGCKLNVSVNPENAGDVEKFPNKVDYDFGEVVELTVVASPNYVFVNWNGVHDDTSTTKIITLSGDSSVTAYFESITGIPFDNKNIPKRYALKQNYPNPFNPETRIDFQLPKSGRVKLTVYNIRGQVINVLLDEELPSGYHAVIWRGVDRNGNKMPSGVYLYRIETIGFQQVKKMILMR